MPRAQIRTMPRAQIRVPGAETRRGRRKRFSHTGTVRIEA